MTLFTEKRNLDSDFTLPQLAGTPAGAIETTGAAGFDYDVAIVGLGYVGLPTAIAYHLGGSRVLGLDVSPRRIETITRGEADLLERDQDRLSDALGAPGFTLTTDPTRLQRAAAIVICVPTPVDSHLMPDLSLLRSACESVVRNVVSGQTVMLTSTTYVGCTQDLLVSPLQDRGFWVGRDVFVAFSAERIDPGNDAFEQAVVPRVVGGATERCTDAAELLLRRYALNVHRVGSLAAAEMTKLLENTFRAVNIALANEFADICEQLDVDVNDVIDAAATKPYGFMAFRPGPGVGGHCIPCDPHYLLWQLREARMDAPLIERTMGEIARRPQRIVEQVRRRLSENGLPLRRARVLVIGLSYKPDVADLRESPALEILAGLETGGAVIGYLDDHFPTVGLPTGTRLEGVSDPGAFRADLVLIHTRHRGTDLSWVTPAQVVLDTRNPSRGRAKAAA